MTPRFFTGLEKGTDELPIVMEEGGEKLCDIWLEETSITSVLLSFNLSWFVVIQDLMSWIQSCMESMSSGILLGGADFCSCMSSAYE